MKKILKVIIILMVIILLLILVILGLLRNINPKIEEFKGEEQSEKVSEKNSNGFQKVSDSNVFYTVQDIINTFIEIYQLDIEQNIEIDENLEEDLAYELDDDDINTYLITDESKKKKILYSLLDKRYIEKYDIIEENVIDYIIKTEGNINLIPIEMNVKYDMDLQIFLYHCYVENIDEREIVDDKYFIIRTDNKNYTIEPIFEEEYNDIDEVEVDLEKGVIESNDYNKFSLTTMPVAKCAQKYIEHYRYLITYYPELAYEYLDEEYKIQRFKNIDNYKTYISKNNDELSKIQINSYFVEYNEDGIRQYVCKDQYENLYVFNEESIMKYSLLLDTYTLENEEFTETYNKSDDQYKVMMNINKWFQMLNNRDYETAFNLLDETFRNNNFNGDINNFETFMRNKYPSHYEVEYVEFSEQPGGIYSQKIGLKEISSTNDETDQVLTIIMKLQEDTKFVMSFSLE